MANTPKPGDLTCKPDTLSVLSTQDCLQKLKELKILAVRDEKTGEEPPVMGIPVVKIPFSEVNAAWEAADKDEAAAIADRWQKDATKVVGVPREVLEQSAAMYLGQKAVLKQHNATAITINCLGGFYGGHNPRVPVPGVPRTQQPGTHRGLRMRREIHRHPCQSSPP